MWCDTNVKNIFYINDAEPDLFIKPGIHGTGGATRSEDAASWRTLYGGRGPHHTQGARPQGQQGDVHVADLK